VAKVLTVAAVALIAGMMVFIAVVFLFIGLFRIFGEFLDMKYIYAIVGGLFLLLGLLLWSRRTKRSEEPQ
jgi:putative Ca2+/H+ antiporter (TMEM165/GDT1 family)